ncbi:MAG: hypothetical protein FJ144_20190 [Deltaproteobacteria bacterium]|nr:hypothetical protein [Deltaproteobacteria bacterium]
MRRYTPIWALDLERVSSDASRIVLELTVLNEALDVVYGRWFPEKLLPYSESSYDDMHPLEPDTADFPESIVVDPERSVSITGPVDFTAWSMARYSDEWAATGGLVPVAAPVVVLH